MQTEIVKKVLQGVATSIFLALLVSQVVVVLAVDFEAQNSPNAPLVETFNGREY